MAQMDVVPHLPLVLHVITKLPGNLREVYDSDELLSIGAMGLLKAADRFDDTRGVAFAVFAERFIYGAMMDEYRGFFGRPGSTRAQVVPLSDDFELTSYIPTPYEDRVRDELWEMVDSLPPREARAVRARYLEGYSGKEIGEQLGVTDARVSQLQRKGLETLAKRLTR